MKKPIVVNLFGGPGAGKSTGAAFIFAELKMQNINCELVREFAKYKTWERNTKVFENQSYIFGKQFYKMSVMNGEVDLIITDSPLLLSVIYGDDKNGHFSNHVVEIFNSYENLNYFINRSKPYNTNGRYQKEKEAIDLDIDIIAKLDEYDIEFDSSTGNRNGYNTIVSDILYRVRL